MVTTEVILADESSIQVLALAYLEVSLALSRGLGEWPEDDWIALSADWDLNISHNENQIFATIYPVNNGQTDTSKFLPILHRLVRDSEFRKEL